MQFFEFRSHTLEATRNCCIIIPRIDILPPPRCAPSFSAWSSLWFHPSQESQFPKFDRPAPSFISRPTNVQLLTTMFLHSKNLILLEMDTHLHLSPSHTPRLTFAAGPFALPSKVRVPLLALSEIVYPTQHISVISTFSIGIDRPRPHWRHGGRKTGNRTSINNIFYCGESVDIRQRILLTLLSQSGLCSSSLGIHDREKRRSESSYPSYQQLLNW